MPRADQNIANFEGVAQTLEDLSRKYTNSTMLLFDSQLQTEVVFIVNEIGPRALIGGIFNKGRWDPHNIKLEHCFILREFPKVGLVQVGEQVYQLNKLSQRQWRRGASEHTMTTTRLYPPEDGRHGKPNSVIYAHAFQQKDMTREEFDNFVKTGDITKPKVINHKFWMVSTDKHLISLFYEDVFVGMFTREKQFISCSESYTLVEEAVHEWGLLVS